MEYISQENTTPHFHLKNFTFNSSIHFLSIINLIVIFSNKKASKNLDSGKLLCLNM